MLAEQPVRVFIFAAFENVPSQSIILHYNVVDLLLNH